MRPTFPKNERLTHKKQIDELFDLSSVGNGTAFCFPLKVIFHEYESEGNLLPKVLASVSKKKFRQAVARNLIKRRIREAYRLNKKHFASCGIDKMAILYVGKDIKDFNKIQEALIRCSLDIKAQLGKKNRI